MTRMTPRRCVNTVILTTFLLFVFVNIQYLWNVDSRSGERSAELTGKYVVNFKKSNGNDPDDDDKPISSLKIADKSQSHYNDLHNLSRSFTKGPIDRFSLFNESLSFIINEINRKQLIRNADIYPPSSPDGSYRYVFVVQVHNRAHYLQHLVGSLAAVRDINSSLLIVSHDYYTKDVFDIVEKIRFMPVLQIFYPKAMQLFKDVYPGHDPKDCRRDMKKPDAIKSNCTNALYPDLYGHYREAPYAQTKLHWFWKLHHVFENLAITKNYQGYVTLIEEDHYITPDALHVLDLMVKQKQILCGHCHVLTLGNYDKKPSYTYSREVVATKDFVSSRHNMAMSINRATYQLIKNYTKKFCDYDDYNWDWSLQYIGKEHIPGGLPTLIVKTPRVYHIGECGVHHKAKKGQDCNPQEKITPIANLIYAHKGELFPSELKIGRPNTYTYLNAKKMKPNGGWGDLRDRQLCASFMNRQSVP